MKRSWIVIGFASVLGLNTLNAFAQTPTFCNLSTLHGTYMFDGLNSVSGVPHAGAGMEWYDGKGNIITIGTTSDGFTPHMFRSLGTYTITPNCIATAIYGGDTANPFTYFVRPDGAGFAAINAGHYGAVAAGREDRMSFVQLVQ